jgi:beta-1,4-N-acetylglucosaminyltransferase
VENACASFPQSDLWGAAALIFVTVGNATQRFHRLLKAVDKLAGEGFFGTHNVFVQTGNNPDVILQHTEHRAFLSIDEFEQQMQIAETVISHGGCGTMLYAARLGKVPVVMPRRKKYDEHVNDHQLQLVDELAAQGRIVPVYEAGDLADAVLEARKRNANFVPSPPSPMIGLVAEAVQELLKG